MNNHTGRRFGYDELFHIGNRYTEVISLDDHHNIANIRRADTGYLKSLIIDYIEYCCNNDAYRSETGSPPSLSVSFPSYDIRRERQGIPDKRKNDPEPYTRFSFMKLTGRKGFPKHFKGFLKMTIITYLHSFTNWKDILKRVGICLIMSALTLVWNIYALCYLNDSFKINKRSIFGKPTAYLLAGIADTSTVPGMPPFMKKLNTVFITVTLYFLLAIIVRVIIRNIAAGKKKRKAGRTFSFRENKSAVRIGV